MEERSIKISLGTAREWYYEGGDLKELALSAFSEEEITRSILPQTWEEFCKMHPVEEDGEEWYIDVDSNTSYVYKGARTPKFYKNVLPSLKAAKAHLAYMQLHQLRDCYRQGWLPDWENSYQRKWVIFSDKNVWKIEPIVSSNRFLSFQSEDIAEKFLNNFKGLIETAGDLI